MPSFQLHRLPVDDDELWWLIRALFGVMIPRTRVCPDHCSPFQALADAYFRRDSRGPTPEPMSFAIWHASRGLAGKSKSMSILGLLKAYLIGADVTVLGGSMAQSANVHEYTSRAMEYKNVPVEMTVDATATKIVLSNRGRLRPLPASQKTVRSPHPSMLLLDEVDEMELEVYDAALGQPMEQQNYLGQKVQTMTVASSTWQNPAGTFTEVLRRADLKGIVPYRWCFRETSNPVDGWLTAQGIAETRDRVSVAMWDAEYELGEPAIGNRAFDTGKVEAAFSVEFAPIRRKEAKDFAEYVFAEPERDARYVIGADWAREQDYTAIGVARIEEGRPRQLVYYLRCNRRPWPIIITFFNQAMRLYHASARHDSTGIGNVINDYLEESARGFTMTGEKRAVMLSEYVVSVEHGHWAFPKIPIMYAEHKYCRTGDLYSSQVGYHLPDTVAMAAMCEYEAKRMGAVAGPVVVKNDGTPSKTEAMFANPREPDDSEPVWQTSLEVRGETRPAVELVI